jgi:hypothetical protein
LPPIARSTASAGTSRETTATDIGGRAGSPQSRPIEAFDYPSCTLSQSTEMGVGPTKIAVRIVLLFYPSKKIHPLPICGRIFLKLLRDKEP